MKKDVVPENMIVAKRIALNMLRNAKEKFHKKSINSKRIHTIGDVEYRGYLLQWHVLKNILKNVLLK